MTYHTTLLLLLLLIIFIIIIFLSLPELHVSGLTFSEREREGERERRRERQRQRKIGRKGKTPNRQSFPQCNRAKSMAKQPLSEVSCSPGLTCHTVHLVTASSSFPPTNLSPGTLVRNCRCWIGGRVLSLTPLGFSVSKPTGPPSSEEEKNKLDIAILLMFTNSL